MKEEAQKVLSWATARPVRLICLTIFCCITVISLAGCTAFGCYAASESEKARYNYRAESDKAFWKK